MKKFVVPIAACLLFLIIFRKCSIHVLPNEKIQFFKLNIVESYDNNEYQLLLKNPVNCPHRFLCSSNDETVDSICKNISPLILAGRADSLLVIKGHGNLKGKIKVNLKLGNPELSILTSSLKALPFPNTDSYELLQGNNSNPTHNHDFSRYAFDFNMSIGDTITSTQNGYVIGAIDDYKGWGYGNKWAPYSNQVMIYDTSTHLFTMYGHLDHNGSLVQVGEYVSVGQPIAISGKTGQAPEEHLHFNVLRAHAGNKSLTSFRLDSIGNYRVKSLKRHQLMRN